MSRLDTVEKHIVAQLEAIDLQGKFNDSNWTKTILRALGKLGKESGYLICATGLATEFDCGAWLYDMVWYTNGKTGLEDIDLVLECEWSRSFSGIRFDFEKLLVARARHRVMIFSCAETKIGDNFEQLIEIVNRSKLSRQSDRYLLLGVGAKAGEIYPRQFIFGEKQER
jgi:hypothetical protein